MHAGLGNCGNKAHTTGDAGGDTDGMRRSHWTPGHWEMVPRLEPRQEVLPEVNRLGSCEVHTPVYVAQACALMKVPLLLNRLLGRMNKPTHIVERAPWGHSCDNPFRDAAERLTGTQ